MMRFRKLAMEARGIARVFAVLVVSPVLAAAQQPGDGALLSTVRAATERFQDVRQAEREGYVLVFGCVTGPDIGAMGLHYLKPSLLNDGVLDPTQPEIVIYEPLPGGGRRLIGADFLVYAADWHSRNTAVPELMGQLLHLFEKPNRFGLDSFYTLHVWAWKENPLGAFTNWHSQVSCAPFSPQP
jgi:hypothetical protein